MVKDTTPPKVKRFIVVGELSNVPSSALSFKTVQPSSSGDSTNKISK